MSRPKTLAGSIRARLIACSAAAIALVLAAPGIVLAEDPLGTGIPPSDPTESWTPLELGYTPEYAAQKELAARAPLDCDAVAATRGSLQAVCDAYNEPPYSGVLPDVSNLQPDEAEPGDGGFPVASSLAFTMYHQKTDHFCLVAVAQSIAHHSFGGYDNPSIGAKQNTIADAMGTTPNGTRNGPALKWLNDQFAANNATWRYVKYDSPDLATFKNHMRSDIVSFRMPMYVRVALWSHHYAWSTNSEVLHATLATGYTQSGKNVQSADPYAHPRADGTCSLNWDGGNANFGCTWGKADGPYLTHEYFLSRDPNGSPEWY